MIVVDAHSETSQPVGEQPAVTSSHDVNTATPDLFARVARLEAFVLGDHNEPKEMTAPQAAVKVGVHRRTIVRWANDGEIPGARQWRGQWHIPRSWVAEQLTLKNLHGPQAHASQGRQAAMGVAPGLHAHGDGGYR